MMILSHKLDDKKAGEQIQKYCLINNTKAKIQYSQVTGKVLYLFEQDYPKGLEAFQVEYEKIEG